MTFDPKKPCTTRSGYPVVIFETNGPGKESIAGRYQSISGEWLTRSWYADGKFTKDSGCGLDLVNYVTDIVIPTHYVNVYRNAGEVYPGSRITRDLDTAIRNAVNNKSLIARLNLAGTHKLGFGLTDEEKTRLGL